MQQPQVPHLILLGAVSACTTDAPAPTPQPDRAPVVYRLQGRVTPATSSLPDAPPFEGGAALVERCGERLPCAAELWQADANTLTLLRVGDTIERKGESWPAGWSRITGALAHCLPDPLAVPPAADPAGYRLLVEHDGTWSWQVHLSGDNACGLEGLLVLDAEGRQVDPGGLACDGLAWREGGDRCALGRVRARRRAHAAERWEELGDEERAELLVELSQDPEAASLVEDLRSR